MQEGGYYTNILKLIKDHGYNKDVSVIVATVTIPSPLTIDVNGMILESNDLRMTETASKITFNQYDNCLILIDGSNFFLIDRVV